jgi:hypothetical protein
MNNKADIKNLNKRIKAIQEQATNEESPETIYYRQIANEWLRGLQLCNINSIICILRSSIFVFICDRAAFNYDPFNDFS